MFWGIVLKLIAGHSLCFILTILVFQMFMDVGALNCYSCKPCPNAGANITCKADEPNCLIAKGSSGCEYCFVVEFRQMLTMRIS